MSQQMKIDQFYKVVRQDTRNDTFKAENTRPNLKGVSRSLIWDRTRSPAKSMELPVNNISHLSSQVNVRKTARSINNRRAKSMSLPNGVSQNTTISPSHSRNLKRKLRSRRLVDEIDLTQCDGDSLDMLCPITPSKYLKRNVSPSKAGEVYESPQKMGSSRTPERSPSKTVLSPKKGIFNTSPSTPSKTVTSPKKKSPMIKKTSPIKYLKHRSPKRRLFDDQRIDTELACQAIDNLNLARQGDIGPNNFDLQELYSNGDFEFVFPCMNEDIPTKYKVKDVVIPDDKHADHLFMIIVDVFVNPVNCGYFNMEELDFIFSMLTLSAEAQMLLSRLLKRKHSWHRAGHIKYPEIGPDLQPYFEELEKREFLTSRIESEKLELLLQLLRADEVREICQKSKINHRGSKATTSEQLLKMARSIKPLFPGMETPYSAMHKRVLSTLGCCIRLSEKVLNVVDRIVMLFMPSQDILAKLAELFLTLTMIRDGSMQYPELPKERHPIFRNREHLLKYVEGRNALREATEARENKHWNILLELGRTARKRVTSLLQEQSARKEEPAVPSHVKKFTEEYTWMKVLTTSFEAFKKDKNTIPELVDALTFLLNQKDYLQGRRGQWYGELALVKMHHNKDLQSAARLTIEALSQENFSEVDMEGLFQRAEKLIRRKGISSETKSLLKNLVTRPEVQTVTVTVEASVMHGNLPGRKSTWSVDMGDGDKGYMKVEQRAIHHYRHLGYTRGLHCEGALPITLFTLLVWEELYNTPVPAAFLSPYQNAPLDLYTRQFYINRKQQIDEKLDRLKSLDIESLSEEIANAFEMRQHYISLMPNALFEDSQPLKEIALCLGTNAIVGICERLVKNYVTCRSGFPDLIVWNPRELKCKIVEVKGPGDTLSTKQTVWLQHLEGLGVSTELCNVQVKGSQQKKKRSN